MIYIFVKIYQNVLDNNISDNLYNQLSGPGFAWYNYKSVVDNNMKTSNRYFVPDVFRHCFIQDYKVQSNWITLLEPLISKINILTESKKLEVINLHANWMFPNKSEKHQIDYPHIDKDDFDHLSYTALYYLNSCSGNTILYQSIVDNNQAIDIESLKVLTEIVPEKNKLVMWNSKRVHSAPAYISEPRMVLNMNLRITK